MVRRVKVKWIDSCSGDCYWTTLNDLKHSVLEPTTYGFLIYEDDKIISIAHTYAEGDDYIPTQVNGVVSIPKVSILEIVDID